MLNLTEEEWASLRVFPPAAKMFAQILKQIQEETAYVAAATCMSDTAEKTAMNYATAVGRIAALSEIVEYRPYPGDGPDGDIT